MKEQFANQFIADFTDRGIKGVIESLVFQTLGVSVEFEVETAYYPWAGHCVTLVDRLGDAATQLTSTPLLRQMFKDAKLSASVGYIEDTEEYYFRVHIDYDHSYESGHNGLELLGVTINRNDGGNKIYTQR